MVRKKIATRKRKTRINPIGSRVRKLSTAHKKKISLALKRHHVRNKRDNAMKAERTRRKAAITRAKNRKKRK